MLQMPSGEETISSILCTFQKVTLWNVPQSLVGAGEILYVASFAEHLDSPWSSHTLPQDSASFPTFSRRAEIFSAFTVCFRSGFRFVTQMSFLGHFFSNYIQSSLLKEGQRKGEIDRLGILKAVCLKDCVLLLNKAFLLCLLNRAEVRIWRSLYLKCPANLTGYFCREGLFLFCTLFPLTGRTKGSAHAAEFCGWSFCMQD